MLKGKVCIDLHNHKSGLTERIEGENLITDALGMFVNYVAVSGQLNKGGNSPAYPLATKALGGICLIDKNFSQGGDIFIPANAKYIGGGSYNFNDTRSKYIGTYNLLESGWNESTKTFKHVYDYSVSQANGVINGIALTTQNAGKNGFVPRWQGDALEQLLSAIVLYMDTENRDVYYTTTKSNNSPIYRIKFPLDVLPLYQGSEGVDTGLTIDYIGGALYIDGHNGYIYQPRINDKTLYLRQVEVGDLSFTDDEDISFIFPASLRDTSYLGISMDIGYIYAVNNDRNIIYKYNTDTDAIVSYDVSQIFGEGYIGELGALPNGGVFGTYVQNYTSYPFRLNIEGGVDFELIQYPNYTGIVQGFLPNGLAYLRSESSTPSRTYFNSNASMLMSNYNLPEEVVKTQAQSMRVSYSITQV